MRIAVSAVAVAVLAACGSTAATAPSTSIRISGVTPRDPNRITAAEAASIAQLGASKAGPPPASAAVMVGMNMNMETRLAAADQPLFDRQWAEAQRAVLNLDTETKAAALGFVAASTITNGEGTHWVNWTQVAKPFDPAHPAMLLFDDRKLPAKLVAFSHWVQSPTTPVGLPATMTCGISTRICAS